MEIKDICRLIWAAYRWMQEQSKVIRSGFWMYGIGRYDLQKMVDEVRLQSDAEHSYGCEALIALIALHFPEIISPNEVFIYLMTAKVHEQGECVIGDIPDDGTRDEEWKNRKELEVVTQFENTFLPGKNTGLTVFFKEFQERSTPRGRFLYAIDKLDAVLRGLVYEAEGHGGDIRNKSKHWKLSEQDKRNMEVTGSTKLVDIWSAHFLEATRDMEEAMIPRMILRVAVEDVRGEWFPWAVKIGE